MADFLTRLAGRTLGLAPTVQPRVAPMYAGGQQFVEPAYTQEIFLDEQVSATNVPIAAGEATPGELDEIRDAQEMPVQPISRFSEPMSLPLVQQRNQPSIMPIPVPHTASKTHDGQPATWQRISQEQDEHDGRRKRPHPTSTPPPPLREESDVGHDGRPQASPPHPAPSLPLREESGVGYDGRRKRPHPTSTLLAPLREPLGRPLVGHVYNQGNQHEVAAVAQESSAPVPTIQVTIGRIEVRAVPPANPRPQPRRSEPPVMGLEEYLNQRAKGGY